MHTNQCIKNKLSNLFLADTLGTLKTLILLTKCHKFLWKIVLGIVYHQNSISSWSLLHSHYLSAWQCIVIVRRNQLLFSDVSNKPVSCSCSKNKTIRMKLSTSQSYKTTIIHTSILLVHFTFLTLKKSSLRWLKTVSST